ncbi:unnamed protein product [Boreogadus saida]
MISLDSGTKPETEFNHFMHILNSHHPRIKPKHTLHLQQVPFLDTIVFFTTETKDGHKTLATKVSFKDTDRHSLLFNTSYHPRLPSNRTPPILPGAPPPNRTPPPPPPTRTPLP